MKRYFCLIVILLIAAVLLMSCDFRMTGKPNDYFGDNNVKPEDNDFEANIEEGDVVKVYGDYIIKANTSGLYVIHTDNGKMTLTASKPYSSALPCELVIYNNYLINVYTYTFNDIKMTKTEIYDLSTLTKDAYDFPMVKDLNAEGEKAYTKIINGVFYLSTYIYNVANTALKDVFNEESEFVDNQFCKEVKDIICLLKINLDDMQMGCKVFSGHFIELCQMPNTIFLVLRNDGDRIIMLTNDFEVVGSVFEKCYYINNRFSISDNGNNIMVVTNNSKIGTRLSIYDKEFKLVGQLNYIAPGETVMSVRYDINHCYIVTYRKIDPVFKIDISDPANPIMLSELELEGYSSYLHLINEDGLAIGFQAITTELDQISLSLISNVNLFDISQDEVNLIDSLKLPEGFGIFDSSNRQILVDRTRDRLILFALRFTETESDEQEQNITTEETYLSVLVISYSEQGIQLLHYFDVKKLNNFSEINKNIIDFIRCISEYRSVIIGNYLYVVTEYTITSYSIEEGYLECCGVMFQTVTVTYS